MRVKIKIKIIIIITVPLSSVYIAANPSLGATSPSWQDIKSQVETMYPWSHKTKAISVTFSYLWYIAIYSKITLGQI